MNIGVPRERRTDEHRVGLTPAAVELFVSAGHQCVVERDAGRGAGFSDVQYERAGARVVYSGEEVYGRAGLIAKVAKPTAEEARVAAGRGRADGLPAPGRRAPRPHRSDAGQEGDGDRHLVDIMRWFTGFEVKTVYAKSNRVFHAEEVQVETGALEMLTFDNQMFATIDASWSRPQYWPTWGGLTFEMVTQRGAVLVDAFRQNLNVYRHEWQRANWAYWGSDMNHAMVSDFAAAIRENRSPLVTGYRRFTGRGGHGCCL